MTKNLLALVEFSADRPRVQLVHDSENLRLVLFCLQAGQEVPPHTSASEVLLQALRGDGRCSVGEAETPLSEGGLIACPPNQPHGLKADTDLVVLAVIAPRPE